MAKPSLDEIFGGTSTVQKLSLDDIFSGKTPQGESGDDHTGGMSRVSALDYWIKNPAKAAGKAIMNDVNLVTHPLDTAVGMAKGIAKPFQDVAKDPKGQLKQFGKDSSYLYISENLVDICNQAEKWKKYLAE